MSSALPQATALATIGKFVIRKKVGEKGAIFGSVTTADIVEAIQMQTVGGPAGGGWAECEGECGQAGR